MTETTRPQVVSAPAGTHRPSLVWPDGIEERSPWPQRTAVLLADERYEEAVDVLRRMNFATVQVRRGVDPRCSTTSTRSRSSWSDRRRWRSSRVMTCWSRSGG
jgi:hypothetical protein